MLIFSSFIRRLRQLAKLAIRSARRQFGWGVLPGARRIATLGVGSGSGGISTLRVTALLWRRRVGVQYRRGLSLRLVKRGRWLRVLGGLRVVVVFRAGGARALAGVSHVTSGVARTETDGTASDGTTGDRGGVRGGGNRGRGGHAHSVVYRGLIVVETSSLSVGSSGWGAVHRGH